MGNVRSLANKMEELTALPRSQRGYWECSVMCFTETWLYQDILDNNISTSGILDRLEKNGDMQDMPYFQYAHNTPLKSTLNFSVT